MCGIFGLVFEQTQSLSPKQLRFVTNRLFRLSESRGKEASGFAAIVDDEIMVHKTPYPASHLVKSKEYKTVFNKLFNSSDRVQAFIGHSRLVTDGYEHENRNNQPVIRNGMVIVHNGIIVNKHKLWENYRHVKREADLDSELIPVILHEYMAKDNTESQAFQRLFAEIYGITNIAILMSSHNNLFLSTNNGSIYYLLDKTKTCFLFASERFILKQLVQELKLQDSFFVKSITQLAPMTALSVSFTDIILSLNVLRDSNGNFTNILKTSEKRKIHEIENEAKCVFINTSLDHGEIIVPEKFIDEYHKRLEKSKVVRRCTKCLIPVTFPFVEFDKDGVCNICQGYRSITTKGDEQLVNDIKPYLETKKGDYDCLVALSGGRDSSYSLYYVKEKLGLKPLAFCYDWGMLTDLARRNQSRVCGKLGVEHILVSADIRKKRRNIRLNVLAWLKQPTLGTIPLFMAGDKQYFYYANLLKKQNNINLVIMGENHLEKTGFKILFSGARQQQEGLMSYHMTSLNKLRMLFYYMHQFLRNPFYINKSLIDTTSAFLSYYLLPHEYINIYDYLSWEEKKIEDTVINYFDWETDPGTKTTWRIGDGTVAFYNYIYYMVAGFTENDTFRSNQIREGMLSRKEALKVVEEENQPRWDSIKWYCDTIGINFNDTIKIINRIPSLYSF